MKWKKRSYTAILRFEKNKLERASGELKIIFDSKEITDLRSKNPLRAYPNDDGFDDIQTACLVNISGGVVSGDTHHVNVTIKDNTKARIFPQAAEKIYPTYNNLTANIRNEINLGSNSWFEWLPQETIIYDNAKLNRSLALNAKSNTEALLGEIVVLGRVASGEKPNDIFLKDKIEINSNNKLRWMDTILLNNNLRTAGNSLARLNNCNCFFTIIFLTSNPEDDLDALNEMIEEKTPHNYLSITCVNGVIIIRGIYTNPLNLRKKFAEIWMKIRNNLRGLINEMPKLWWI